MALQGGDSIRLRLSMQPTPAFFEIRPQQSSHRCWPMTPGFVRADQPWLCADAWPAQRMDCWLFPQRNILHWRVSANDSFRDPEFKVGACNRRRPTSLSTSTPFQPDIAKCARVKRSWEGAIGRGLFVESHTRQETSAWRIARSTFARPWAFQRLSQTFRDNPYFRAERAKTIVLGTVNRTRVPVQRHVSWHASGRVRCSRSEVEGRGGTVWRDTCHERPNQTTAKLAGVARQAGKGATSAYGWSRRPA